MMIVSEAPRDGEDAWNAFVAASPLGSFLQSWQWGTFQAEAGFRILRLEVRRSAEDNTLRAVCLVVIHALPMGGCDAYVPWGPVLARDGAPAELSQVLDALRQYVRTHVHGCTYIRLEPNIPATSSMNAALQKARFIPLDRGIQPKDTLLIDLKQSEDDLLRQMHSKTRYNIRVAMRHGVNVEERTTDEGLAAFLELAKEVSRRGTFHYHTDAYYRAMLATLARAGMLAIRVATHDGSALAAGLFVRFGDTVTYAHGASSHRKTHVMASHALHWETIMWARDAGAATYDFFGIAPAGAGKGHTWAGITRFKRGFGGTERNLIGIADAVLDPVRYRLYSVARGFRGILNAS